MSALAIAIPVLKRGMSMCLAVLIAKGFGVVEERWVNV